MVGATKSFIRKPFIVQNIKLGVVSALLAMGGMVLVLYYLQQEVTELDFMNNRVMLISLFVGVLLFGFLISLISTYLATQRFLNLRIDKLYN